MVIFTNIVRRKYNSKDVKKGFNEYINNMLIITFYKNLIQNVYVI